MFGSRKRALTHSVADAKDVPSQKKSKPTVEQSDEKESVKPEVDSTELEDDLDKLLSEEFINYDSEPDDEPPSTSPIGLLSWDWDDVVFDYLKSKSSEDSKDGRKYYFLELKEIQEISKLCRDNNVLNIVTTARFETEKKSGHWLSVPMILTKVEAYPGELFDAVHYTNGGPKSEKLHQIGINENGLSPDEIGHADNDEGQIKVCKDKKFNTFTVKPNSKSYLTDVRAFVEKLIAAKKPRMRI
jgi:hypothetical protein